MLFRSVHPRLSDWLGVTYPNAEYRQRALDQWLLAARLAQSGQVGQVQCRLQAADGQPREVQAQISGHGTLLLAVLIDITERVEAQQRLQASQERLQRILDNLPIPVIALRRDAVPARATTAIAAAPVSFCNRRFYDTFGYGAKQLGDAAGWIARACPDTDSARRLGALLTSGTLAESVLEEGAEPEPHLLLRADGERRDVLINGTQLPDLLVLTLLDITDLNETRQRERQLEEEQRRRLEQKLRTSLAAAAVVHEINQPLSALLLNAQLARQRLLASAFGPDRDGLDTALHNLVDQAERVVSTMHKMRSLLRNVRSDPRPLDLAAVVGSALLGMASRLESAAVDLRCQGLERPCLLLGDAEQLQVAISNLLRNALEALVANPTTGMEGRIAVALRRHDNEVVLSIGDSGPGISGAVLESLPLQTTKPDGTGIGLYVVQTAMENHQGRLEFARSPLGGAEVRLHLPLAPWPVLFPRLPEPAEDRLLRLSAEVSAAQEPAQQHENGDQHHAGVPEPGGALGQAPQPGRQLIAPLLQRQHGHQQHQ